MIDILLKQMLKQMLKPNVKTRYSQDKCHLGTLC